MDLSLLVLAVVIGLVPAKIAHDKGYDFWLWWIFGALLWIVATPWAILLKPLTPEERAENEARKVTLRNAARMIHRR
jgi:hypothetical protein